jgi:hypothetical protein
MGELRALIGGFERAIIKDLRGKTGGRLWVEDPKRNAVLAEKLKRLGFRWANARFAWYYPDK